MKRKGTILCCLPLSVTTCVVLSKSKREKSARVAAASFVEYLFCCRLLLKNTFVLVQEEATSLRPTTLSQSQEPSGQAYRLSDCTYHRVFVSLCTLSCLFFCLERFLVFFWVFFVLFLVWTPVLLVSDASISSFANGQSGSADMYIS